MTKTTNADMILQQKVDELTEQVMAQAVQIERQAVLIQHYEHMFIMMKRRQFGASSEKTEIDIRQMTIFGENTETIQPETEPETEEISYSRKKRKGKREEDLSGLPVKRVDHELPEDERTCPKCGEVMGDIGTDVRQELEVIPAQVIVVEHAAHTYACENCKKNSDSTPIKKAESPKPLISGSLASPSMVAHIAVQKYSNGMPLYRIEKGFSYDGVVISRQTMANWVIKCAEIWLVVIYSYLKAFLLKESVLHADETTVQVLHELDRAATTKSYEWVYRTSGDSEKKIIIYEYQETRRQEHPKEFLKDFKGFLHTDGYNVYHDLPPDIIVVGCWSHVRRPWENILKAIPQEKRKESDAARGLTYINKLFENERKFKELTPEERYERRLAESKPISDAFFEWVERLGALPKSPLGQAVHYSLSQRTYLENVYLDGRLELSNNRCERSVKPFVMGRKAWLFSNTPNGARASSIMYSIIETAKENGLHPYYYVKFLLESLPYATTGQVESLLPWSLSLPDSCRLPVKNSFQVG